MTISETQPYRTFVFYTTYTLPIILGNTMIMISLNDHSKKHHKKPHVIMSTANCYSNHSYRLPYLINSYEPQANCYHKIIHFLAF